MKQTKLCFEHNAAYSNSKNLAQRTIADKTLKERDYKNTLNPKYDGYQTGVGSMVYKFLDKKTGSVAISKVVADGVEVLLQELYKTVIKNFKRSKGHPRFQDNIWSIKIIVGSDNGCRQRYCFLFLDSCTWAGDTTDQYTGS